MAQIIIGCIVGNIITLAAIGAVAYIAYRKNRDKIDSIKTQVSQITENISGTLGHIQGIHKTIDDIKNKLNKFPFKS